LAGIPTVNSFDVEIAYKDVTYSFIVERIASDISRMSVADAQVACAADGALLATFGGETHGIFGMDEPLGLRLVVDGNTILMYELLFYCCEAATHSPDHNFTSPGQRSLTRRNCARM
jgi:hypothetical protein